MRHDRLNSIPETCVLLGGIAKVTLYQWLHRGRIAYVRIGRRVFVPDSEIRRLVLIGTVPAIKAAPGSPTPAPIPDFKLRASGERDDD